MASTEPAGRRVVAALLVLALSLALARAAVYRLYPLRHWPAVSGSALDHGLEPLLVAAVIRTESSWNPQAVSGPGARGLMQVMPATAAELAGDLGLVAYRPEDLFQPELNIRLGTLYLARLARQFGGEPAALAAYNSGAGQVRQWLDDGRWDGSAASVQDVPFPETREFVRRVLRDRDRYRRLYHPDGSRRW